MTRTTSILTVVLLALALAGCGSSSTTSPPAPTTSPSTSPSTSPPTSASTSSSTSPTPSTSPTAVAVGVDAPGLIAFRRYNDSHSTSTIFTIHPDGTGETQVSHPPEGRIDDQPAISADGTKLAWEYCTNKTDDTCHVVVSGIDGSTPHVVDLTCPKGPICDTQAPAWGPDGRLVVNRSWGESLGLVQHSDLVVMNADGSAPSVVTTSKPYDADLQRPMWSPDGKEIAYVYSGADGRLAIRVLTIATGRTRQVTPFALHAGDAVDWSPDGAWLSFHTHEDSEGAAPENVGLVHPDGSGLRDLTHNPAGGDAVLSAAFSPDSRWLVFGEVVSGQPADLFEVPVTGGTPTPLTQTEAWDSAPEWGAAG